MGNFMMTSPDPSVGREEAPPNLFVDDVRRVEDHFENHDEWAVARTYDDAIRMMTRFRYGVVSLDHDLGSAKSGYDVMCAIERGDVQQPEDVWCHSYNPVGRQNIERAIASWKAKRTATGGVGPSREEVAPESQEQQRELSARTPDVRQLPGVPVAPPPVASPLEPLDVEAVATALETWSQQRARELFRTAMLEDSEAAEIAKFMVARFGSPASRKKVDVEKVMAHDPGCGVQFIDCSNGRVQASAPCDCTRDARIRAAMSGEGA